VVKGRKGEKKMNENDSGFNFRAQLKDKRYYTQNVQALSELDEM
jgi:hypothetical protein